MDLFKILGSGARFAPRKRARDTAQEASPADISSTNTTTTTTSGGTTSTTTSSQVAAELDFFGNSAISAAQLAAEGRANEEEKDPDTVRRRILQQENNLKNKESSAVLKLYTHDNLQDAYQPFASQEKVAIHRKQHRIKCSPDSVDCPPPIQNFLELGPRYGAKPYILKNLVHNRFPKPTPIQMQAIPVVLDGKDLLACAPTGTGKTVAYLAPLLMALKNPSKSTKEYKGIRSVIISPTRELALQVERELQRLIQGKPFKTLVLTNNTTKGGLGSNKGVLLPDSSASKRAGTRMVDILISTPQKLVHEIQQGNLKLSYCSHLILDEADRLLDMGFLEQMDEIIAACDNSSLQKLLFSATIPSGIETLAKSFMNDPVRVTIGVQNSATDLVNQKLMYVGQEQGKILAVRQMIKEGGLKPPVLIFVETIDRAKNLFHELVYEGINVDVMHGDRSKHQRDEMVQRFREGKIWVLICTELLARGIDFKGVNLVINYDFPISVQSYIHRIGRTGRAGRKGDAITFFTKEDRPNIMKVVNVMKNSGCEVPEWLLTAEKVAPKKTYKKKAKKSQPAIAT